MSDVLRYTIGFLMLNWPIVLLGALVIRWIWKDPREPRQNQ